MPPKRAPQNRVTLATVALGIFAALACDPNIQRNPNENSGNDAERSLAQQILFGEPVNDNVNYNQGDMTDWRYFQAPAAGSARVTLGCDYTSAYCAVVIRDEVGVELERLETRGQPRIEGEVPVGRGNYYLEVFVSASSTDYTIQVDYEPN